MTTLKQIEHRLGLCDEQLSNLSTLDAFITPYTAHAILSSRSFPATCPFCDFKPPRAKAPGGVTEEEQDVVVKVKVLKPHLFLFHPLSTASLVIDIQEQIRVSLSNLRPYAVLAGLSKSDVCPEDEPKVTPSSPLPSPVQPPASPSTLRPSKLYCPVHQPGHRYSGYNPTDDAFFGILLKKGKELGKYEGPCCAHDIVRLKTPSPPDSPCPGTPDRKLEVSLPSKKKKGRSGAAKRRAKAERRAQDINNDVHSTA